MTCIGVISDTHGLMRPEALECLRSRGVQQILHAGDVGSPDVLSALRDVAPTVAVRGNADPRGEAWAAALPPTRRLTIDGKSIYLLHELKGLELGPAAGMDVVIFGHTHAPSVERQGGVLRLNPGSAGPDCFPHPVSLAILVLDGPRPEAEIVYL